MQDRAILKKTIAMEINAAIEYLVNNILRDRADADITADFFTKLEEMENHLETAENDEESYSACQRYIWKFNSYVRTTIHYQENQIDFLHNMRRLTDNLTVYAQKNAIKSEKSAASVKMFGHGVQAEIKNTENTEGDHSVKSLRSSH